MSSIGLSLGFVGWAFLIVEASHDFRESPGASRGLLVARRESSQDDALTAALGVAPSFVSSDTRGTTHDARMSILFIGDIMLDRTVETRISRSKDLFYPFRKLEGEPGEFFRGQDMVVANIECPITDIYRAPQKEIDFACSSKLAPVLAAVGIDAVSQANNHTLDQGRVGLEESRQNLTDAGLAVFGDQVEDDEASAMTLVEQEKGKVALIGWNTTDNKLDRDDASLVIASAKEKADHVIVFMHWGSEYRKQPNQSETELAHWLIDQGVDAVIGAHPHWMQTVEVYQNKPIVYSLGNFIFDQDWSFETRNGLAVKLIFGDEYNELELWPVRINQSQAEFLVGADRETRLKRLADISDPGIREGILRGVLRMKP